MTKECAIDLCKAIDIYLCAGNPIWDVEKIHDAMSMAIEALQAQTTLDDVSNAYENGYQQGKFEATQKTGKWIFVHPIQEDDSGGFLCSCCKYGEYKQSNYCPHCGAKMECEEE